MYKIEADLFDVASRIKEIDARYDIYYNTQKERYEVFVEGERQCVVPFAALDERTVRYLRKTRKERLDRLLAEIEWANASLEAAEGKRREEIALKAKALISYLKSERGEYVPSYDEI